MCTLMRIDHYKTQESDVELLVATIWRDESDRNSSPANGNNSSGGKMSEGRMSTGNYDEVESLYIPLRRSACSPTP